MTPKADMLPRRRVCAAICQGAVSAYAAARGLSQQLLEKSIQPVHVAGKRALVLGNSSYPALPHIQQARGDAADMTTVLQSFHFEVTTQLNLNIANTETVFEQFYRKVQTGDLALVYYSGHGGAIREESFLLPVDFRPQNSETAARRRAYSLSDIRDRLEARGATARILIFDACRNASMISTKASGGGMAPLGGAEGTLVAFASAPHQVARFDPDAKNSYYTAALLQRLRTNRNTDLKTLLERTQLDVYVATDKQQRPWLDGFITGRLYIGDGSQQGNTVEQGNSASPATEPPPVSESAEVNALKTRLAELTGRARVMQTRINSLTERLRIKQMAPAPDILSEQDVATTSLTEAEQQLASGDYRAAASMDRAEKALRNLEDRFGR